MTYNPKIKNTSNADMSIDANIDAKNITMGDAEDNDWTDGIFTFSTETNVGTAIDKINELLKGLAPKVPSELDNLSTTSAGHDAAIYINGNSTYSDVSVVNGAVVDVADKSHFNKETSPDFTQLGAYLYDASDINIVLDLNGNKEGDAEGSLVNLRENAFLAEVGKTLEFKISINEIELSVVNPLQFLNSEVDSPENRSETSIDIVKEGVTYGNITLQPTQYGKFFATQADFTQFVHRTGTVTLSVNPSKFRKGFNYVIVSYKHTDEQEWKHLNKVSFFLEDKEDRGITTLSQTLELASGIDAFETKSLSGIKYYKQVGASYYTSQLGSIVNFGQHTYSPATNGGIEATDTLGVFQASQHNFKNSSLTAFDYNGASTEAFTFSGIPGKRYIGDIFSRVIVSDAYGQPRTTNPNTITIAETTIFYDSVEATSTDLVENFDDEEKRINSDGSAFDSTTLGNNDLIVYDGILCTHNNLVDLFAEIVNDTFVPAQVGGLPPLNTTQADLLTYERTVSQSNGFSNGTIKIEGIPSAYKLVKVIEQSSVTYQIQDDSGTEVIKIYFADSSGGYKNILRVPEAGGVLQGNPQPPTPASNEVALVDGTLEVQYNLLDNTIAAGNSGKIKVEMINKATNQISKITVS